MSAASDARIRARLEIRAQNIELAKAVLANPVVELLGLYLVAEWAQRQQFLGPVSGTALEAAGTAAVGLQQLAPLAPYIAQSISGIGGIVAKVAPALAAAGAA